MFPLKPRRITATINSSSLADIAFLLLIFFLVTTTINVDTGIGLTLPPPLQDDQSPVHERNLMNILVNSEGKIMMDDKLVSITEIKPILKQFIDNRGVDSQLSDTPQSAVVSLITDRKAPYRIYIDMLDEVIGTYNELRNEGAIRNFGKPYNLLSDHQRQIIKDIYPKKISIAESSKN